LCGLCLFGIELLPAQNPNHHPLNLLIPPKKRKLGGNKELYWGRLSVIYAVALLFPPRQLGIHTTLATSSKLKHRGSASKLRPSAFGRALNALT